MMGANGGELNQGANLSDVTPRPPALPVVSPPPYSSDKPPPYTTFPRGAPVLHEPRAGANPRVWGRPRGPPPTLPPEPGDDPYDDVQDELEDPPPYTADDPDPVSNRVARVTSGRPVESAAPPSRPSRTSTGSAVDSGISDSANSTTATNGLVQDAAIIVDRDNGSSSTDPELPADLMASSSEIPSGRTSATTVQLESDEEEDEDDELETSSLAEVAPVNSTDRTSMSSTEELHESQPNISEPFETTDRQDDSDSVPVRPPDTSPERPSDRANSRPVSDAELSDSRGVINERNINVQEETQNETTIDSHLEQPLESRLVDSSLDRQTGDNKSSEEDSSDTETEREMNNDTDSSPDVAGNSEVGTAAAESNIHSSDRGSFRDITSTSDNSTGDNTSGNSSDKTVTIPNNVIAASQASVVPTDKGTLRNLIKPSDKAAIARLFSNTPLAKPTDKDTSRPVTDSSNHKGIVRGASLSNNPIVMSQTDVDKETDKDDITSIGPSLTAAKFRVSNNGRIKGAVKPNKDSPPDKQADKITDGAESQPSTADEASSAPNLASDANIDTNNAKSAVEELRQEKLSGLADRQLAPDSRKHPERTVSGGSMRIGSHTPNAASTSIRNKGTAPRAFVVSLEDVSQLSDRELEMRLAKEQLRKVSKPDDKGQIKGRLHQEPSFEARVDGNTSTPLPRIDSRENDNVGIQGATIPSVESEVVYAVPQKKQPPAQAIAPLSQTLDHSKPPLATMRVAHELNIADESSAINRDDSREGSSNPYSPGNGMPPVHGEQRATPRDKMYDKLPVGRQMPPGDNVNRERHNAEALKHERQANLPGARVPPKKWEPHDQPEVPFSVLPSGGKSGKDTLYPRVKGKEVKSREPSSNAPDRARISSKDHPARVNESQDGPRRKPPHVGRSGSPERARSKGHQLDRRPQDSSHVHSADFQRDPKSRGHNDPASRQNVDRRHPEPKRGPQPKNRNMDGFDSRQQQHPKQGHHEHRHDLPESSNAHEGHYIHSNESQQGHRPSHHQGHPKDHPGGQGARPKDRYAEREPQLTRNHSQYPDQPPNAKRGGRHPKPENRDQHNNVIRYTKPQPSGSSSRPDDPKVKSTPNDLGRDILYDGRRQREDHPHQYYPTPRGRQPRDDTYRENWDHAHEARGASSREERELNYGGKRGQEPGSRQDGNRMKRSRDQHEYHPENNHKDRRVHRF